MVLLVSSYDQMIDSWLPFFCLLRKLWPDCPYRTVVITNHVRFDEGPIESLALGDDRGWSSNLLTAIDHLGSDAIFYFQEDHFLLKAIDQGKIDADEAVFRDEGFDTLTYRAKSLRRSPGAVPHPARPELMIHPPDSTVGIYCDPSMWRVDALQKIVQHGESAWDFLAHGRDRAVAAGLRKIHYRSESLKKVPIHYFKRSGIREGLWKLDALQFLRRMRVPLWPLQRGLSLSSIKLAKRAEKEPQHRGVQMAARAAALLPPVEEWQRRRMKPRLERMLKHYRAEKYPINHLLEQWQTSRE